MERPRRTGWARFDRHLASDVRARALSVTPLAALCLAGALALAGAATPAHAGDDADQSCIEIESENSSIGRLDCLNRDLRRLAETRQAAAADRDGIGGLGAKSPAPALGLFNQAGVAERLGTNFGHSAFPQRPTPPTYALPFGGTH